MELQEIRAKLLTLSSSVDTVISNAKLHGFAMQRKVYLEHYFLKYQELKEELSSKGPVYKDLQYFPAEYEAGRSDIIKYDSLKMLALNIGYCLELLKNLSLASLPAFSLTKEGIFFTGDYYEAYRHLAEILKGATKSIIIIDGYINDTFLDYFKVTTPGMDIKILTKDNSTNNTQSVKTAGDMFNKGNKYGNLSIRFSNAFHDRFVIIDTTDYYHFGASLKDMGSKGFMFSLIEEDVLKDALRREFEKEWKAATVFVP
jgi:hypothetical protein